MVACALANCSFNCSYVSAAVFCTVDAAAATVDWKLSARSGSCLISRVSVVEDRVSLGDVKGAGVSSTCACDC